jgi:hypothetical protein
VVLSYLWRAANTPCKQTEAQNCAEGYGKGLEQIKALMKEIAFSFLLGKEK